MFLLTIFTTLVVGARLESNFINNLPLFNLGDDAFPLFHPSWILERPARLLLGVPFSATLMLILFAHEMGHYLFCLRYRVNATLPFFIPAPTLIGTLGAFIRIRSPIPSRAALFDIGIAGPIAGFVVAIFALAFGLYESRPGAVNTGDIVLGYPWIFHLVKSVLGPGGTSLSSLEMHPVAIAAWVGMFATALNLLPGGQLDGGHIVFSLMPSAHKYVSWLVIGILIPLGIQLWPGWLVWAVLLSISGLRHPRVPGWPGLSPGRKILAIVALVMLVLTFTPAPMNGAAVPHL